MAETLQNHCHLDDVCPPAEEYLVRFSGRNAETPTIVASARRSLTGKVHVHTLAYDGDTVIFRDQSGLPLLLDDEAGIAAIEALLGKIVYFTPNMHEDLGSGEVIYSSIRTMRMVKINAEERTDPMEQYWTIVVELIDLDNFAGTMVVDDEQGALSYLGNDTTTAEFRDASQDFADWETAAPGTAVHLIVVTNSDSTLSWGYCGDSDAATDIDVYTDIGLTTRGWLGTLPVGGSKTPSSYEVIEVIT